MWMWWKMMLTPAWKSPKLESHNFQQFRFFLLWSHCEFDLLFFFLSQRTPQTHTHTTHIHIHTHIHTHTLTNTHIYKHAHLQTHIHTHKHTKKRTRTQTMEGLHADWVYFWKKEKKLQYCCDCIKIVCPFTYFVFFLQVQENLLLSKEIAMQINKILYFVFF